MAKNLEDAIHNEKVASSGFADLKNVKDEEIEVASESIETKEKRAGELAVSVSQNTDALEDAQVEKADSEKFLAALKVQCVDQKKAWEDRFKLRTDEIAAISEAINILNDDDARDTFSKTSKSALLETAETARGRSSFLQRSIPQSSRLQRARAILEQVAAGGKKQNVQMTLLLSVLNSKARMGGKETGDFGGVVKMLDGMMDVLKKEQTDDEKKKAWCTTELQKADGQEKVKQEQMDTLTSTVEELEDEIKTMGEEIKTLQTEIRDLDRNVADATEQRKKEHAEYVDTGSMTEAAIALIAKAKNRLQKFYNPSQYKKPAAGAAFFAQVHTVAHHDRVAPPELPNIPEYKPAASGGILGLMDQITQELHGDMKEAQFTEQQAQKDYVKMMQESQVSRAQDLKSITDTENSKAVLEEKVNDAKESRKMAFDELNNAHQYTAELHNSCDFVVQNFGLRSEARTNELESLRNAKAVMMSSE